MGYQNIHENIELSGSHKIDLDLQEDESILEEVVIEENREEVIINRNQMSQVNLTTKSIIEMPGFMGETELIKSLQAVPGIKSYGDGSVFFYVRGGNKDQNLILIDEAPIYNPSHLLGFFSSFTPDAIKDVKIYKGDIPLSQGGALSSLIDIKTKDGNMKKFGAYGSVGLISTKLSLEGPIRKDKSSFFISSRRSHLELYVPKNERDKFKLYFKDFNAKLNYKFNDNNRLYFTLYTGKDYFASAASNDIGAFGVSWGNSAATLRWNHLFNDKLFSNTTIYTSRYDYRLILSVDDNNYWNETIANLSLKTDFTYFKNPKNKIKFGTSVKGHYFDPGNLVMNNVSENVNLPEIPQSRARHFVTYIASERKFDQNFTIKYGIRLNTWHNIGPTTVYKFDSNHEVEDTLIIAENDKYETYRNLEPRISFHYKIDSTSTARLSIGRTTQYLQLLSNSVSPFTSLEVWLPAGPNIKPQKADQIAIGYNRVSFKRKLDLTAELYYKIMKNQIDYKDHANMLLNPLIEGELRFGKAWSYGIEFLIKKTKGRLSGWLGYTLSKTMKKIEGVNNGVAYPAYYDRPHDLSVYLTFKAKPRWNLSANWIYSTGSAITTPTSFYYYQGYMVPIYASKNNDRMPDYHRLDVSANFKLNKNKDKKYQHSLTFSIYNVYARKNPVAVNFNKKQNGDGNYTVPSNLYAQPEYIATQIYLLGIIPSINYNFTF
ncbi:MAG: TonB-dependent receptor plug domain-containing protein [Bacteroidia bacterium]|nr:TonB-dependent receptor plug domain-containing protein [Bacteroidia bacterium]